MAENSKIQWTDHTFNPWRGCTKVSPGCANCYAEMLSGRNPGTLGVWGPNGTRVVASEAMWREPVRWNKAAACTCNGPLGKSSMTAFATCPQHRPEGRPRVFCASLADVFEDWTGGMSESKGYHLFHNDNDFANTGDLWMVSTCGRRVTMQDVRFRLLRLIHRTPNLDWLLLTKRPENVSRMLADVATQIDHYEAEALSKVWHSRVWLGTSVENQQAADARVPHLLSTPAAVRFISCEPLLGPVDLRNFLKTPGMPDRIVKPGSVPIEYLPVLGVDWVIVGGESGPDARPCNVAWVRSIVEQCKAAGVPVFVKQLGAVPQTKSPSFDERDMWTLPLRDKKGGDMAEWCKDLRVREFPKVQAA